MRLTLLASTASLLLACTANVPPDLPTSPPPPPPAAAPAPPPPEPARPPGPRLGDHALVFKTKIDGWTNQIVIAPWGDVVAISGHKARLLARTTGEELLQFPICFVQSHDAAAFIDDKRMLLACGEGIDEVTFPEGTVRRVFRFPEKLGVTAVGGGRVVVAADGFFKKDDFKVRVYSIPGFSLVDEFDAGAPVRAVGVSADGKLVGAGIEDKGLVVRDVAARSTRRYLESGSRSASPVHFSPDGASVFTYASSFTGGEVTLATGAVGRAFHVSSWLSTIRYLDDGRILGTGAGGLMLFSGKSEVTNSPVDNLGEGLDLSPDKSFFCAAGRHGEVACFSNKAVAPTTFVKPKAAPPSDAPPSDAPPSTPPKASVSLEARVLSRSGKTLVVSAPGASSIAPGRRGQLARKFDLGIFNGTLVVAVVEVKKVDGDRITLTVEEKKSDITMNGKKVDHLAPKTAIILSLD